MTYNRHEETHLVSDAHNAIARYIKYRLGIDPSAPATDLGVIGIQRPGKVASIDALANQAIGMIDAFCDAILAARRTTS